jgi:hypothetical protein
MQLLRAGAIYFALVFGAGFVLGPVRILWLQPRVGERAAELTEAPVMLVAIFSAAYWVSRRFVPAPKSSKLLAVGCVALGLLLLCEFGVVLWLRGLTLAQYVAHRDPVAGSVYIFLLGVLTVMPLLLGRRK